MTFLALDGRTIDSRYDRFHFLGFVGFKTNLGIKELNLWQESDT